MGIRFLNNLFQWFLVLPFLLMGMAVHAQQEVIEGLLQQVDSLTDENQEVEHLLQSADSLAALGDYPWLKVLLPKAWGDYYMSKRAFDQACQAYAPLLMATVDSTNQEKVEVLAKGINDYGIVLFKVGRIDEAKNAHFKSLKLYGIYESAQGYSYNYNNLGLIEKERRNLDSAIYYYQKSSEASLLAKDTIGIGYNAMNLGILYSDNVEYIKALDHFQKSIDVFSKPGHERFLMMAQNRLAAFYIKIRDFKSAKPLCLFSLNYYMEKGQENRTGMVHVNLAEIYWNNNQLDSSSYHTEKGISILHRANYAKGLASAYFRKGEFFAKMEEADSALVAYDQAYEFCKGKFKGVEQAILSAKAEVYGAKGDYHQAIELASKALSGDADKINQASLLSCYQTLYRAHKRLSNTNKAMHYLEKYQVLQDTAFAQKNVWDIARIEYQNHLKREETVKELEQEKQKMVFEQKLTKQRWLLYIACLVTIAVITFSVIIYRFYRARENANLLLENQAVVLKLKNDELEEMRMKEKLLIEQERAYMEESIANKERQLATITMLSYERNTLLEQLQQQLHKVKDKSSELKEADKLIQANLNVEQNWESFVYQFENVHPKFFKKIKGSHPELTSHDLKIGAYLKIGLDNKAIAQVTNVTVPSVKKSINRFKKRLGLEAADSLRDYILNI